MQPLAWLEGGLLQPLLALLDRSGHWELPSLRQGEYVVVEAMVVWELPSLALREAVGASDPSMLLMHAWAWIPHRSYATCPAA